MDPRPDFCPGCGAQVYPEETHCPFCGRSLRSFSWFPFMVGLGGMGAALLVGALVWWVLDGLPPAEPGAPPIQQEAAAPPSSDAAPQAAAPQPGAAQAAAAVGVTATPGSAFAPLPGGTAPVAGFAPPPDAPIPTMSTKDTQRFAPGAVVATAPAVTAAQTNGPLPTVNGPAPEVAADAAERRAFAQTTQERFVENGLDLSVKTSGTDDTTVTITFNFPAKTAAELIVAGPFPNQCAQRGFTEVIFVDPSGISWLYDMTSKQLTQRQ